MPIDGPAPVASVLFLEPSSQAKKKLPSEEVLQGGMSMIRGIDWSSSTSLESFQQKEKVFNELRSDRE
jgi:hypothetical protein